MIMDHTGPAQDMFAKAERDGHESHGHGKGPKKSGPQATPAPLPGLFAQGQRADIAQEAQGRPRWRSRRAGGRHVSLPCKPAEGADEGANVGAEAAEGQGEGGSPYVLFAPQRH